MYLPVYIHYVYVYVCVCTYILTTSLFTHRCNFRFSSYLGYYEYCFNKCRNAYISLISFFFSFPLGTYPEVRLLDHMVALLLIGKNPSYYFPYCCTSFQECTKIPFFSTFPQHLLSWIFLHNKHVILVCVSLMISDIKYLSMYVWAWS